MRLLHGWIYRSVRGTWQIRNKVCFKKENLQKLNVVKFVQINKQTILVLSCYKCNYFSKNHRQVKLHYLTCHQQSHFPFWSEYKLMVLSFSFELTDWSNTEHSKFECFLSKSAYPKTTHKPIRDCACTCMVSFWQSVFCPREFTYMPFP